MEILYDQHRTVARSGGWEFSIWSDSDGLLRLSSSDAARHLGYARVSAVRAAIRRVFGPESLPLLRDGEHWLTLPQLLRLMSARQTKTAVVEGLLAACTAIHRVLPHAPTLQTQAPVVRLVQPESPADRVLLRQSDLDGPTWETIQRVCSNNRLRPEDALKLLAHGWSLHITALTGFGPAR